MPSTSTAALAHFGKAGSIDCGQRAPGLNRRRALKHLPPMLPVGPPLLDDGGPADGVGAD
jgi:hypothetical protein